MKKLTLSAEEEIIELAKKIAREHKTSVSTLFSRFVRFLSAHEEVPSKIGPIARSVSGIIKFPKGKTERKILEDALMEKEGL